MIGRSRRPSAPWTSVPGNALLSKLGSASAAEAGIQKKHQLEVEVHVDIGFIGLGIMGQPMALNLVKAGTPLLVWTARPRNAASWPRPGPLSRRTRRKSSRGAQS